MAEILKTPPQITLNLPNSQIPLDFIVSDDIPSSLISRPKTSCAEERSHFHQCHRKDCTCAAAPLIPRPEQHATDQDNSRLTKQPSMRWLWKHFHRDHANKKISTTTLSTTLSNTASSNIASVPDPNSTTTRTSSGTSSPWLDDPLTASLLTLPTPILRRILLYAFSTPHVVSLNQNIAIFPSSNRTDHITIQQLLQQPIFLVCHYLRKFARDFIFSRDVFVVDLAGVYDGFGSSHHDHSLKKLQQFWVQKPSWVIKQSLKKVSKLVIRVPVPSTEAAVRRGREEQEWMDGSDGKGGGGYRMKSMKEEAEDSLVIRRCLRGVVQLLLSAEGKEEETVIRSGSRVGKSRHPRKVGIWKSESVKSLHHEHCEEVEAKEKIEDERQPLRLLEIVLVKRSSWAMVLREVLGLVHVLRDVPVKGILRICFELNGRKSVWATKRKERWEGMISNSEPDGAKLLHDLQHLRASRPPDIQPILSPTEFKHVTLSKEGRLLISPTALRNSSMEMQDLIMPATPRPRTALQRVEKQRTDSFAFIMAQGIRLLGSAPPPDMLIPERQDTDEKLFGD